VVRMKGKGGSGSGDSSLNQLLSASLEQINQIEAVYNSGGDAAGQFFGGVPLTASAPPSEEEEEEGVYRWVFLAAPGAPTHPLNQSRTHACMRSRGVPRCRFPT